MKPIILLYFIILSISAAQSTIATAPTITETGPEGVDQTGTLHLQSGNLPYVVAQVEKAVPALKDANGKLTTMPNVIFSPEAEAAMVLADLRLRDVSPVQALALVATAAGCTIEPILAPKEAGAPTQSDDRIIGYRVSLAATPRAVPPGMLGVVMNRAIEPSALMSSALPGTAARRIKVVDGDPASNAGPSTAPSAPQSASANANGLITESQTNASAVAGPTVRVYALGGFLRGDPNQMKEKQVALQTLVEEAMERAELPTNSLTLSFHSGTKALIVKGTAAQHEIIGQVITAMKENTESEAEESTKK
jgi:hypothetical protein